MIAICSKNYGETLCISKKHFQELDTKDDLDDYSQ